VSVAVLSGMSILFDVKQLFASRAGQQKCKQFTLLSMGNVFRGRVTSQQTRLRLWMTSGTLFFLVSEVAVILTAVITSTLSDMRRGN